MEQLDISLLEWWSHHFLPVSFQQELSILPGGAGQIQLLARESRMVSDIRNRTWKIPLCHQLPHLGSPSRSHSSISQA